MQNSSLGSAPKVSAYARPALGLACTRKGPENSFLSVGVLHFDKGAPDFEEGRAYPFSITDAGEVVVEHPALLLPRDDETGWDWHRLGELATSRLWPIGVPCVRFAAPAPDGGRAFLCVSRVDPFEKAIGITALAHRFASLREGRVFPSEAPDDARSLEGESLNSLLSENAIWPSANAEPCTWPDRSSKGAAALVHRRYLDLRLLTGEISSEQHSAAARRLGVLSMPQDDSDQEFLAEMLRFRMAPLRLPIPESAQELQRLRRFSKRLVERITGLRPVTDAQLAEIAGREPVSHKDLLAEFRLSPEFALVAQD